MKTDKLNQWLTVLLKSTCIIAIFTFIIFLLIRVNGDRYSIISRNDEVMVFDNRNGDIYRVSTLFWDDNLDPVKFNVIEEYKKNVINKNSPQYQKDQKEKEEKRIADSIRVADSLAMVQAEQQRIFDSIVKVQEDARRAEKIRRR